MKRIALDQMKDKHVGNPQRDKYEFNLQIEVLGDMIKSVRKERNTTVSSGAISSA
ncbi:MAG: hypothetical protein AAF944_14835 [Bacteroidota bacterium]